MCQSPLLENLTWNSRNFSIPYKFDRTHLESYLGLERSVVNISIYLVVVSLNRGLKL